MPGRQLALRLRHMEAVTAGAARAEGTGSKTIADLLPLAVKKYGDKAAQRYKVGEEWVVTLNEDGLPRLRVSSS